MPPLATAHMFCASRYGPRISSLLTAMPAKTDIFFCAVSNYAGIADLGKGYRKPKRKLGVTAQFSEIAKLQVGKNAIHCFASLKNTWLPPIFFLDSSSSC